MWGVLTGYFEDVDALRCLGEREERMRRGALEKDMLMEMALWAMVDYWIWRRERCGVRSVEGMNVFVSEDAIPV